LKPLAQLAVIKKEYQSLAWSKTQIVMNK
jgi:hypothetical protein